MIGTFAIPLRPLFSGFPGCLPKKKRVDPVKFCPQEDNFREANGSRQITFWSMTIASETCDKIEASGLFAASGDNRSGSFDTEADVTDREDMERLVQGQEAALGEIMDRHGQKLFNYLIRSLQNEEDAADLAQETFVRVFEKRDRFDPNQKFSTWLYAIASNLVKDRFRWRTRHPQVSIDAESNEGQSSLSDTISDPKASPIDIAQQEERANTVRKAIAALPEELRMPLILAEYEDKAQSEIAVILGCSIKAVETRIYRARQRLRKDLASLLAPG